MREILFRGKNKLTGYWCEGFLVKTGGHFRISTKDDMISFGVIPETVGQYIGLKDKNGTRIFEGDIIENHDFNTDDGGYGVIEYDDGAFEINGNGISATFHKNYWGKECEVVGNIYDNPELLGGADK